MKNIKFYTKGKLKGQCLIDQVLYTGFEVGYLPSRFAFIFNEDKDQDGITKWFNFQGLTYIPNWMLGSN